MKNGILAGIVAGATYIMIGVIVQKLWDKDLI